MEQYMETLDVNFKSLKYSKPRGRDSLSQEVEPWCDGKCLSPKATGHTFKFGN